VVLKAIEPTPPKSGCRRRSENPVIHPDKIADFAMGDPTFERELIHIYLKTFRQLPEQVRECLAQADVQQMNALLHKVKPTLQSLAAQRIENTLRTILQRMKNQESADDALQQLIELSAVAIKILQPQD
jgi:HPt (histidine-containing phosphotransfer) domain-containing protein